MDGVVEKWQMSEEDNRIPLLMRNSDITVGGVTVTVIQSRFLLWQLECVFG